MRKNFIAGNWKMYKTAGETEAFFDEVLSRIDTNDKDVVIFPPFTSLAAAVEKTRGTHVAIGAQNVHYEDEGAFTGEVSCKMLRELGVRYVIIGHSERRKYFAENNETVKRKVIKALSEDIIPVVCVGEDLNQREEGIAYDVIRLQVLKGLQEVPADSRLVVAYEPVWAIGTGKTATAEQAEEACANIRTYLRELFGDLADEIRILYGGSVKPSNIRSLMEMENIDGVLVGGASLNADFVELVHYDRQESK